MSSFKKHSLFFFVISVILANPSLAAETPESLFQEGKRAYEEGSFQEAITLYQTLHETEQDASSQYNLGNAYFATEQWGKAILAYERARLLDPRAEDIQENLLLARRFANENAKKITGGETLSEADYPFWRMVSPGIFWIVFLCVYSLFWAFLFFTWKRKHFVKKGVWFPGLLAGIFFFFSLFFGFSYWKSVSKEQDKRAVVLQKSASVRRGAIPSAEVLYRLPEGEIIPLEEIQDQWARIRLEEKPEGWVSVTEIELIQP